MTATEADAAVVERHDATALTISLYVHVPFCVVKCGYCDFNSFAVADADEHDRFLDALDRELSLVGVPRSVHTVFVGGGTPTYLDSTRFTRLWEILRRHVDLDRCREVTVECNPESLTPEKARIAFGAGVRRASVGAQTFNAERLRFLDRAHDASGIARAVEALRSADFTNVSLDLIFALPGQTLSEWEDDLQAALRLEPDHLSCYSLTYETGTRLGRELARGQVQPVPEDVDREMFLRTREILTNRGFVAYEISNFAGRGGPSLHNDHYWLQGDYLGVGPGAASHLAGWRGTNLKPIDTWVGSVARGLIPTGEAETLDPRRRVGEALWLGLRRSEGVDLAAVETRLAYPVLSRVSEEIGWLVECGLLEHTGDIVRLTSKGLLVADAIASRFLVV